MHTFYIIDKPDVSELFQDQFDVIGEAIGSVANFDRTIDKLFARKLVSRAVYDDLTTTNSYSIYQKGTKVVRELNRQIESSKEPEKTLVKICDVLQNIEDRRLRDVVDKIKIKLEGKQNVIFIYEIRVGNIESTFDFITFNSM